MRDFLFPNDSSIPFVEFPPDSRIDGDSQIEAFLAISDVASGERLSERYVLEKSLGAGAFGNVFLAFDEVVGRKVAIKTIPIDSNPEHLEFFKREIQLIRRIEHGNIVRLYGFGSDQRVAFMVLEFVDGKDLGTVIRESAPMRLPRAVSIMLQILDGLTEAHQAGVIHRDLKPQNIIITHKGARPDVVKIVDFGIAKSYELSGISQLNAASQSVACGTPLYMAPEQIVGAKVGPATDVYSAGLIFYELLSGRSAFTGTDAMDVLAKKAGQELIIENNQFGTKLTEIIRKATARNPLDRYATALDFYRSLAFVADESTVFSGVFEVISDDDVPTVDAPEGEFARIEETGNTEAIRKTQEFPRELTDPFADIWENQGADASTSGVREWPSTEPGDMPKPVGELSPAPLQQMRKRAKTKSKPRLNAAKGADE